MASERLDDISLGNIIGLVSCFPPNKLESRGCFMKVVFIDQTRISERSYKGDV